MSKLCMQSEVARSSEMLWDYLKRFSVIGDWNLSVKLIKTDGDIVGSTRTIVFEGVGEFVERLEMRDESERVCTYAIIDSPLDVKNCTVQIKVKDNGDGTSLVEWDADFIANSEQELSTVRILQTLYQEVLDNLELMLDTSQNGEGL